LWFAATGTAEAGGPPWSPPPVLAGVGVPWPPPSPGVGKGAGAPPPPVLAGGVSGSPLAITVRPSGAVISKSKVALSLGWSLLGNQVCAPLGWQATKIPSGVRIQPYRPRIGSCTGRGVPE